jgi:hypothetical protein
LLAVVEGEAPMVVVAVVLVVIALLLEYQVQTQHLNHSCH